MQIPARILRAEASDIDPSLRDLTIAQEAQRDRILAIAQHLMLRHGPHAISFTAFARALKIGPATLRRFFCDLDELLAHILSNHLADIARAMGEATQGAADPPAARRAAYMRFTRAAFGGFTPAHYLFTAYHHLLPPDLLEPLQTTQWGLGAALCPGHPHQALALLDAQALTRNEIEAALAAIAQARPQVTADPANPPEPAPEPPDPAAPITMRTRDENLFGPRHPDDVYILKPSGHGESTLVHAPPKE